jgi:Ca2+-binding RTX toxin-like protein
VTKKIRLGVLTLVALVALGIVSVAVAHRVVVIKGTNQGETLNGTEGRDLIMGRGGADTINANGGNDRARGGPGNDTVNGGEGNDVLRGRWGNDTVNGDNGNDRIWVGRGADVENGGAGDDRMHALARDRMVDRIDCGEGHDVVWLNSKEADTHVNCEVVKTVTTSHPDDGE